jgi:hypothetical protein
MAFELEIAEFTRGMQSTFNALLQDDWEEILCEHPHATYDLAQKCGEQLLRVANLGCESDDGHLRIPGGAPKLKCAEESIDCPTMTRMGKCAFHLSGRKTLRYT